MNNNQQSKNKFLPVMIAIGLLILLYAIIAFFAYSYQHQENQDVKKVEDIQGVSKNKEMSDSNRKELIDQSKARTFGRDNAPYHIVAFIDYRCSNCFDYHFKFANKQIHDLIKQGRVQYTEVPFKTIDNESHKLAEIDRLLSESSISDKEYWSLKEDLYNAGANDTVDAKKVINDLKIAQSEKDSMLKEYTDSYQIDNSVAKSFGVNSTPTLYIDGHEMKDPVKVLNSLK